MAVSEERAAIWVGSKAELAEGCSLIALYLNIEKCLESSGVLQSHAFKAGLGENGHRGLNIHIPLNDTCTLPIVLGLGILPHCYGRGAACLLVEHGGVYSWLLHVFALCHWASSWVPDCATFW